jgi:hypothetical protein
MGAQWRGGGGGGPKDEQPVPSSGAADIAPNTARAKCSPDAIVVGE